jgi:hypothetical protein
MEQILEQAAIDYSSRSLSSHVVAHRTTKDIANISFQAGAEWQKRQSNWVSVKDKLPETTGRYLIYFPERSSSPMDAIFNVHEKTWGRDFDRTEYVTHWMPIPEPPQD